LNSQGSQHTRRAYERALERFKDSVRKPLGDVGGADVQAWKRALHNDGLSHSTVNVYLSAISSFYQYCIHKHTAIVEGREQGLTQYNPVSRVDRPTVRKYGKARGLTTHEAAALLSQPDRTTFTGLRDYAIILMALLTGRRSAEIRNLRWGDIYDGAYYWRGKYGAERTDELPAPVAAAIANYRRALADEPRSHEPVFVSMRYPHKAVSAQYITSAVAAYAKRAGIAGRVTFHTLRHTYARLRSRAGHDIVEISRALGHQRLDTTQIYLAQVARADVDGGWCDVWREIGEEVSS
jgi:site-specific recombinase XerD